MLGRVAYTVTSQELDAALSPFFRYAPWVLVIDGEGERPLFVPNRSRTAEGMVKLISGLSPDLLICGHVTLWDATKMGDAGIEVRIGPCSVPARKLLRMSHQLPIAPQVVELERARQTS